MTASTPSSNLSRHLFGLATLANGLITLTWHNDLHHLTYIVFAAAAAQIFGGAAVQFRTAKMGAVILCAGYLVLTLLCVSGIVSQPRVYSERGPPRRYPICRRFAHPALAVSFQSEQIESGYTVFL